jgi:light-regulated signal transduction histidine kinase (bacteriophytochrome)
MQLKKGSLDEKTKENYMQIIFESAHKMGSMVDDLLMFSKMSRTEMHKKNINMTGLFKTIYGELTEHLKARTIEFRVDNLPEVIADISMIRLVVTNILSNAIKYSRNVLDATITISSETDSENKKYIYIIEDNGAGFDMNYYDKLFGVFQRLHSQTEFEGTGIGLANAKRIIQRHGGKIWAHSTPGLGARFSFSLPM